MATTTSVRGGRDVRFFHPALIGRLGSMELKARTVVEGFLSGLHRSPYKGFSVEFAEYRQYLPGDDLSTLDWKVYARSDRIDCFRRTDPGTRPGRRQVRSSAHAPRGARSREAGFEVQRRPSSAPTRGGAAETQPGDPDPVIKGLRHLKFRGTEVVVFQLLDPNELTFPFKEASRFKDVETDEQVVADPARARADYLRQLAGLTRRYDSELRGAGIDYVQLDTSKPLDFALTTYLSAR